MCAGGLVLCRNTISIEENAIIMGLERYTMAPEISPGGEPQPFLPSFAPSPLIPFINNSTPALSGTILLMFCHWGHTYNAIFVVSRIIVGLTKDRT